MSTRLVTVSAFSKKNLTDRKSPQIHLESCRLGDPPVERSFRKFGLKVRFILKAWICVFKVFNLLVQENERYISISEEVNNLFKQISTHSKHTVHSSKLLYRITDDGSACGIQSRKNKKGHWVKIAANSLLFTQNMSLFIFPSTAQAMNGSVYIRHSPKIPSTIWVSDP